MGLLDKLKAIIFNPVLQKAQSARMEVEKVVDPEVLPSAITLEEAAEIFGNNFLGPDRFEETWGFRPKSIPSIPFTRDRLEEARDLEMMLVLHVDKTPEDFPMTMEMMNNVQIELLYNMDWCEEEDFYTQETPRLGWRLISKMPLPDSTDKNVIQNLEGIGKHLQNVIFARTQMPEVYRLAITEFEQQKSEINSLIENNQWPEACRRIAALELTRFTLPTPVEVIQTLALYYQNEGDSLLPPDYYIQTGTPASEGYLVELGETEICGVEITNGSPKKCDPNLGILLSLQA